MRAGKLSGPYFILILIVIAAVFFAMLRPFLISILLAAILAGLIYPVYNWMRRRICLSVLLSLSLPTSLYG